MDNPLTLVVVFLTGDDFFSLHLQFAVLLPPYWWKDENEGKGIQFIKYPFLFAMI